MGQWFVSRLVCNGDEPTAVADAIVSGLRAGEGADGVVRLKARRRFTQGDPVRIDGVLISCFRLYEGVTEARRVTVLLDLLGRKVRVVVDDLSMVAA